jgi:hypothetical protein
MFPLFGFFFVLIIFDRAVEPRGTVAPRVES